MADQPGSIRLRDLFDSALRAHEKETGVTLANHRLSLESGIVILSRASQPFYKIKQRTSENPGRVDSTPCLRPRTAISISHVSLSSTAPTWQPRTRAGGTPLHCAASSSRPDIARILTDHGANVAAQDQRGSTPLHEATFNGYFSVAQIGRSRIARIVSRLVSSESLHAGSPIRLVSSTASRCFGLVSGSHRRLGRTISCRAQCK